MKYIGYLIFIFFGVGVGFFFASILYKTTIAKQVDRIAELSYVQVEENIKLVEENKKLRLVNEEAQKTTKAVCKQKRVLYTAMAAHYDAVRNLCAAVPMNKECSWTGLSLNELKAAKIAIQGLSCP